jgi:predicted phage tail protein
MSVSVVARATALVVALAFAPTAFAAPPKASGPTNLRITASSKTSVTLAWDAAKNNSSSWWYCVQRSGSGCFRVDPPKTTFTYPLLQPATSYSFSVVTVDSRGNRSAPSNTVTFTTPPDTTPPSAPVLSTTSVVPTRISLTWTSSVDDMSSQVSYTLLADGSPVNEGLIGFNGLTLAYFQPSSTHVFKVIARDRSGNTAESNTLTVTTPPAREANAPTAPSNLRLSSETSAPEIWLDWDAASDDTDAPGDLLYEVHINGVRVSTGIGNVEDIVYCQVTGENRIAVRAIDTSGNISAFSNEIVFVC